MKTSMLKKLVFLAGMLLLTNAWALSDHKDNGGDGFLTGNDSVTLRDFMKGNSYRELSAQEIIEKTPSFRKLIKKMMAVSPAIGTTIYASILDLKFIMINEDLPKLEASTTGFDPNGADIQIAIRRGRTVIISTPAYEKTKSKEYLLLHEVLHGLVKKHLDWSPMKHTVVRSLVNETRANLDTFTKQEFENLFEDHGASFSPTKDTYKNEPEFVSETTEDDLDQMISFFLNEESNFDKKTCAYFKLYAKRLYSWEQEPINTLIFASEKLNSCQSSSTDYSMLLKNYPLLASYIENRYRRSGNPNVWTMHAKDLRSLSSKYQKERAKESCKKYTAGSLIEELTSYITEVNKLRKEEQRFVKNFKPTSSIEEKFKKELMSQFYIDEPNDDTSFAYVMLKRVNSKIELVKKNRKVCKARFTFTNFKK